MVDNNVKRFGDMQPEPLDCDEKVSIEAILDTDLEFLDFQELSGQYGDFIWIQVKDNDSDRLLGFSTGGNVIVRKLREAKQKGFLPLVGKIVKKKRYYDII